MGSPPRSPPVGPWGFGATYWASRLVLMSVSRSFGYNVPQKPIQTFQAPISTLLGFSGFRGSGLWGQRRQGLGSFGCGPVLSSTPDFVEKAQHPHKSPNAAKGRTVWGLLAAAAQTVRLQLKIIGTNLLVMLASGIQASSDEILV